MQQIELGMCPLRGLKVVQASDFYGEKLQHLHASSPRAIIGSWDKHRCMRLVISSNLAYGRPTLSHVTDALRFYYLSFQRDKWSFRRPMRWRNVARTGVFSHLTEPGQ